MVRPFIPILLIAFGLASDFFIYHRYHISSTPLRFLWWIPLALIMAMVVYFFLFGQGMEKEYVQTEIFLLMLGLFVLPKMIFTLVAWIPRIGLYIGSFLAAAIVFIILWGITVGFSKLQVRHIVYESSIVPPSFDGYKIVQFSDAHTGVFRGPYQRLVRSSVETINAQNADLVCFVGDIENFVPSELTDYGKDYARIKAKDGVLTIMGNHDYSTYVHNTPQQRIASVQQTRDIQRGYGWRMLQNENIFITRKGADGTDSIAIVGEENWGLPPFPQYGDMTKALKGLTINNKRVVSTDGKPMMSIMLSHDPTAWRAHILPVFHPDITLSGHTHGAQFSIFGWSPVSLVYNEWGGEYYDRDDRNNGGENTVQRRLLSVTTGFGGNFSFRFGMPREIVVITLKHKQQ